MKRLLVLTLALALTAHAALAQESPLARAAASGDVPSLRRLLASGAGADVRNAAGETLLYLAAENGRVEAARLLLERRADPNARTANGETPLHAAALDGNADMIELLLEHRANTALANKDGEQPLFWAAATGNLAAVAKLAERGPRSTRRMGKETPLCMAQPMAVTPAWSLICWSAEPRLP